MFRSHNRSLATLLALLLVGAMLLTTACRNQPEPDLSDSLEPSDVSEGSVSDVSQDTSQDTDVSGDTTTDASADATDTTGDESRDTSATTQGSATSGVGTTTTAGKQTQSSVSTTTTGAKNTTTKVSTTKNTTTTTTKNNRVTGMFGSTTTTGGGGITLPSQNGDNKGYEFDPGDDWTLFWNDEFDGYELDSSKWNVADGREKDNSYHVPKNVKVDNGVLILTARRENYKGRQYTTSSVTTADKFSFQYGRLEFRARLTYGQGVWPALWTLGDSYLSTSDELGWPVCGEIDVMEMIGGGSEADKYTNKANALTTCNLHWGPNRDEHYELNTLANRHRLEDGVVADSFHVYAVEWDKDSMKFYFDDEMLYEISLDDPTMGNAFHQPHWLIMNVSLCNWEPECVDDTTPFPQSMYVDYVRVYKQK